MSETRAFTDKMLSVLGLEKISASKNDQFFVDFDKDKKGVITKDDMRAFILKVMSE